ncbi:MAG TPA: hypothetical protein VIF15_16055 [Polyangiaceae bacterium]|jgi:hypothetical protein
MRSSLATIDSCLLAAVVLASSALPACDKDDSKGAATDSATASASTSATATASATAPATASATASAGPPPPSCPAGLTGNAVPAFCIKMPASYHVKDARITPAKGSIAYDTGVVSDNLMISYDATPIPDQVKDVTGEMKFGGDKLEKKGDLPGGGKWFQGSHEDYERVVTLIKGPSPLTLKCSFTYKPKSPPPKDAIDACKSIVLP